MVHFISFPLPSAVRILLALLLLAVRFPAAAQAPAWQSAQAVAVATARATNNFSQVKATAVDAAGNVYVAGNFSNTVALGGTTLTSLGGFDAFVAKLTDAGPTANFVWAQQGGGSGSDAALALAVSGTNVYVTGYFDSSTAGFGPATLANAGATTGGRDVFVAKLTDAGPTGSFAWAQRAGGTGGDGAGALAVRGTSVYVAGSFASATASFGSVTLTTAGNSDAFVTKLTDTGATGSFVWAQPAGGTANDYANALLVSGTAVYVAGYFDSPTAVFGATALTGTGTFDGYVAKLTDAGNAGTFAWVQQGGDAAFALALSGTSVYVGGAFLRATTSFGAIRLANPDPYSNLGSLAALTDPTLTTTAGGRIVAPGHLFPNPAHGAATLRLPAGTTPVPLTLTDALGRAVRRYPAPAGPEAALDLHGLPAGLYLLRGAGPARRLVVE